MNTHEPNQKLKSWNITSAFMFLCAGVSHILSVHFLPKVNMIFNFMLIILKVFKHQFLSYIYYIVLTNAV